MSAQAKTLEAALDELSGVVCLATGDGEAVFELDPPASGSVATDLFVALAGNSGWFPPRGFSLDEFETLYEGGVCRKCFTGRGFRSKVPLPVGSLGAADLLISWLRGPSAVLASEQFRNKLTAAEQAHVKWLPIDFRGKSRRRFFELRASRPLKIVADKSVPTSGWRCPDCKSVCFGSDSGADHVAETDLHKLKADLVMIDNSVWVCPAISYSRWQQIRGKPGARNVVSREVVPVPAARVRRRPELRVLTKSDSHAIREEFRRTVGTQC